MFCINSDISNGNLFLSSIFILKKNLFYFYKLTTDYIYEETKQKLSLLMKAIYNGSISIFLWKSFKSLMNTKFIFVIGCLSHK